MLACKPRSKMFGFFKSKDRPAAKAKEVHFRSNQAAFEYALRFIPGRFVKDGILIGLVVDRVVEPPSLLKGPKLPRYTVRLATEHGAVEVSNCGSIAESLALNVKIGNIRIEAGDLVAVEVAAYDPKVAVGDDLNYFLIMAKLQPTLSTKDHMFKVYDAREH